MKKLIKLRQFLKIVNKTNKKDIKLNVEGKFNNQGKFSFQIKNIICDKQLAKELGFKQVIIDRRNKVKSTNKFKQPTLRESVNSLRELMVGGFNTLNKRIDVIDKKVDSLDKKVDSLDKKVDSLDKKVDSLDKRLSRVEANQKNMMNTPTMKKELENSNKLPH